MQHGKLRSIEKATRALEIEGHEVSTFGVAIGERCIFMGRTEGPVECIETASRLSLIEAGVCDGVNHQTRLVTVFGGCGSRNDFQRLNGIYWNLSRKGLALLVRDRLVV